MKSAGGRGVWLRPRSSDRAALEFLYLGYHLPPGGLAGPVGQIVVFGANIGLLAGDLAARYPGARVLGAEPDAANAELARRNLAHLGGRCVVVEAAVWWRDERLALGWEADAWGREVMAGPPRRGGGGVAEVDAVDAGRLLAGFTGGAPVDYLLVNIESAWQEMLRHGEWTRNGPLYPDRDRGPLRRGGRAAGRDWATRCRCSGWAGAPSPPGSGPEPPPPNA